MTTNIKPCPFCGGRAEMRGHDAWTNSGAWWIYCVNHQCAARTQVFEHATDARDAWNGRRESLTPAERAVLDAAAEHGEWWFTGHDYEDERLQSNLSRACLELARERRKGE